MLKVKIVLGPALGHGLQAAQVDTNRALSRQGLVRLQRSIHCFRRPEQELQGLVEELPGRQQPLQQVPQAGVYLQQRHIIVAAGIPHECRVARLPFLAQV